MGFDLCFRPKPAFVNFVVIDVYPVVTGTEKRKYQFFFAGTFPKIGTVETSFEFCDAQLFKRFTL